jgi:hypothetical protein
MEKVNLKVLIQKLGREGGSDAEARMIHRFRYHKSERDSKRK